MAQQLLLLLLLQQGQEQPGLVLRCLLCQL
jgi:hypothetical protein